MVSKYRANEHTKIREERNMKILKLWHEGVDKHSIAERLGISYGMVNLIVRVSTEKQLVKEAANDTERI